MASGQAKRAESRAEKSAGSSTESSAGSRGRLEWIHVGPGLGTGVTREWYSRAVRG
jgi:hypothetical protein